MFKNRSFNVKMIKDVPAHENNPIVNVVDPERLAELYKESLIYTTLAVVTTAASIYTLKTLSTIAINICPKR